MKFIYIMVLFSSILFSSQSQNQIILGSYSVKNNGLNAVKVFEEQIQSEQKINALMQKYNLRVISTEISGYTVVSVNHLESYNSLLDTLKVLKVHYADAFVLHYPTKNIKDRINLIDIEEEALAELTRQEEEKRLAELNELARIEKEILQAQLREEEMRDLEALALENKMADSISSDNSQDKEQVELNQEKLSLEMQEVPSPIVTLSKEDDSQDYYMIFGGIAILLILLAGIIISNRKTKEDT